jgi:hypothetical protein
MRRGQNRAFLIILQFFIPFLRAKVIDNQPPPVVDLLFLSVVEVKPVPVDLEPEEVHSQLIFHFRGSEKVEDAGC